MYIINTRTRINAYIHSYTCMHIYSCLGFKGDVNAISRVHTYLESIGAINAGLYPQSTPPRDSKKEKRCVLVLSCTHVQKMCCVSCECTFSCAYIYVYIHRHTHYPVCIYACIVTLWRDSNE